MKVKVWVNPKGMIASEVKGRLHEGISLSSVDRLLVYVKERQLEGKVSYRPFNGFVGWVADIKE